MIMISDSEDVVSSDLLRVLRYIALVDEGGGSLSNSQIDAYANTESVELLTQAQAFPEFGLSAQTWRLLRFGTSSSTRAEVAEVARYFVKVGWISQRESVGGRRLTSVGRALVKAMTTRKDDESEVAVVLSPDDPLNVGVLTREMQAAKEGLLVDPYFSDDLFEWLWRSTSLTRVLLCRRPEKLRVLEVLLGGLEQLDDRALEIRYLPPRSLHDRYVIGADQAVSMIGASLNGLHRNFTALVPMPDPSATAVREKMEQHWSKAIPVKAQQLKTEPPPASDDDSGDDASSSDD